MPRSPTVTRIAKALALRDGGASWDDIAARCKYPSAEAARKAVTRSASLPVARTSVPARTLRDRAEQLLGKILDRLEERLDDEVTPIDTMANIGGWKGTTTSTTRCWPSTCRARI